MSSSIALKEIYQAARPIVEQALDVSEQFAAFREAATAKGLDWGAIKALLKAQIQDERDGSNSSKRVNKLVEKADFTTAYADMLGLGTNMNEEKNISGTAHDPVTGEILTGAFQGEGGHSPRNETDDARAAPALVEVASSAKAQSSDPATIPDSGAVPGMSSTGSQSGEEANAALASGSTELPAGGIVDRDARQLDELEIPAFMRRTEARA